MKAVIVHAVLAVFGLGFAYQTWTREPEAEEAPGAVTVAECKGRDLQSMTLETSTNRIAVEPQQDKGETLYWITVTKKPKDKPKPDAGAAEPPKEEAETLKPKRFLANAAFSEYLKQLEPLRAAQGLGTLPKDKLADFGFDKVDTTLAVKCAGKQLDFEAGARTFGTGQRYLRDTKSKAAYLFNDTLVGDLQSAQFKFMQNELHGFQIGDVEEATVEVRGTKKRLLQRDRKRPDVAQWVDAAAPAKRNELYGNWFSRLSRVRVREFLPTGAEPGSELTTTTGEITPVLRLDYKLEGKPPAKLELVRVQENEGGTPRYYARTETTRGWVTVADSSAKEVEQDAAMVVGLEEAPASKTEGAGKGKGAPAVETSTSVHGGAPHGGAPHGGLPAGHPTIPQADPHAH